MIVLDSTQSLRIKLAGAPATTQPSFLSCWRDGRRWSTPGSLTGAANGTSYVTIVAAPASGVVREVENFFIRNRDTAAVVLTIEVLDSAVAIELWKVTLAVDDTLEYSGGNTLTVNDSTGAQKQSGGGGGVSDGDKGDITISGSGAVYTIDNDAVTYSKIQNVTTARLLGRATAGSGDAEEITLGTNLSFTGTTLNATGGGSGHTVKEAGSAMTARTGLNFLAGFELADDAGGDETEVALDLSEVAGSGDLSWSTNTPTIPNDTVTFAKMQDISTAKLLGRATAATGNVEEITLGTNLSYTGTTLNASGGGGMTAQDQIDLAWDKKFFSDAALLPATERIAASTLTVPTETGSVLGGGSLTRDTGHLRFTGSTGGSQLAYYDLGALRSEMLVVVAGGTREAAASDLSICLTSGAPASALPDGYLYGNGSTGLNLYKVVSGTPTQLGATAPNVITDPWDVGGLALYYKDSTGDLKCFARIGNRWFLAISTTDSTYTTQRYVSLRRGLATASTTARFFLPFTAWSD